MVQLKLVYETVTKPKLGDLSALLYDYELLYDFLVLSTRDQYKSYKFSNYFWYRSGRPLIEEDRLQIQSINYGSPLRLSLGPAGPIIIEIIAPLIEISGVIADWKSDRRKAKAEAALAELKVVEKSKDIELKDLLIEATKKSLEGIEYTVERERLELEDTRERRQVNTVKRLGQRLSSNPYKLVDITIHVEEDKEQ